MTDTATIQATADRIAAKMLEKGFRSPHVSFDVASNTGPGGYARWGNPDGSYNDIYKHFSRLALTMDAVLTEAEVWIEAEPSTEQRRFREFTEQLAKTIELGKANGIEASLVNPLEVAMKKLSRNALAAPIARAEEG